MILTFTVTGPPVPCARARVVRGRGQKSKVVAFTPAKTRSYESLVQLIALAAVSKCGGWPVDAVSYAARLRFYRAANRGDLDNFCKAIMDGCNGVVFADDRLVHRLSAEMFVDAERPRAEVEIEVLDSVKKTKGARCSPR